METKRRRRKWGWFFVVLFVLELIFLGVVVGHDLSEAARVRSFAPQLANRLNDGVLLAVVVGLVVLSVTFAIAFVGLRERKSTDPQEA